KLGKPVSFFMEDEETARRRLERNLEIDSVEALLSRPTAAQALEKAEALLAAATSSAEICRLHLIVGTALNLLVRGPEALTELTAAERLQSATRLETRRRIKYQIAVAFRHSGNSPRAIQLLRQLLDELETSTATDQLLRLRVLKDLGVILIDSGSYEEANSYLLTALEWANDIGDLSALVSIYNGLGYAHRALGDLDAAVGYVQRALAMNEAVQDLTSAATMHNFLAVIAGDRGHFDAAMRHVDRAINLARASGPAYNLPHFICTKAECELKQGNVAAAQLHADEALAAAVETGNKRAAAAAKLVLSDVHRSYGDVTLGERQLKEAADIYRGLGASAELGDTYMRLSKLATESGDSRGAQRYANSAYRATKRTSALLER
ncbi:MAG TPA: tetratricopeptide repeat protein, partial [Candidatus Limnocylindria bacterium]